MNQDRPRRLEVFFARHLACFADRALVEVWQRNRWHRFTGAEVTALADEWVDVLRRSGIREGDRVVLISEGLPETLVALIAIWQLRATAVLLDPTFSQEDLAAIIPFADPRGVLVSNLASRSLSYGWVEGLPVLSLQQKLRPMSGYDALLQPEIPRTPDPEPKVALILFTSGTMGNRRGVKLSHHAL
ncbi:MAG: acyl--CoA ligase, partial [Chromatiaceae bacterium]|nr:acyl--CoA ligase [Chromatiaceae bacterium]